MCDLPFVDITAWTQAIAPSKYDELSSEHLSICHQWDECMKMFGFVVLTGHGLNNETFDQLFEEATTVFAKSMNEKVIYNHGKYGHPNGGYTPPGFETVALSVETSAPVKHDPVENFVFVSSPDFFISPNESQSPFASASSYFRHMEILLQILHRISSVALNLPYITHIEHFYDERIPSNASLGRNGNTLRITHYPPAQSDIISHDTTDTTIRYGAHTDYQGFTILRPDKYDWHKIVINGIEEQCGGLEVLSRAQQVWLPIRIPLGLNALVINAGDLIQRWTNDRWHSPLHRVVNAQDGRGAGRSRQALVFFTGPLEQCLIEPFAECCKRNENDGDSEESRRYPSILAGDHLLMKLNRTN
jgi:isopenicillin N synthase-like dioxygenase